MTNFRKWSVLSWLEGRTKYTNVGGSINVLATFLRLGLKKAVVRSASLIAKDRSEFEINARVIIVVDMIINTFEVLMTGVRSLTR